VISGSKAFILLTGVRLSCLFTRNREGLNERNRWYLTEIPEELHESLKSCLETHPDWDQDRVFAAALSLFFSKMEMVIAARFGYIETLFHHCGWKEQGGEDRSDLPPLYLPSSVLVLDLTGSSNL